MPRPLRPLNPPLKPWPLRNRPGTPKVSRLRLRSSAHESLEPTDDTKSTMYNSKCFYFLKIVDVCHFTWTLYQRKCCQRKILLCHSKILVQNYHPFHTSGTVLSPLSYGFLLKVEKTFEDPVTHLNSQILRDNKITYVSANLTHVLISVCSHSKCKHQN